DQPGECRTVPARGAERPAVGLAARGLPHRLRSPGGRRRAVETLFASKMVPHAPGDAIDDRSARRRALGLLRVASPRRECFVGTPPVVAGAMRGCGGSIRGSTRAL